MNTQRPIFFLFTFLLVLTFSGFAQTNTVPKDSASVRNLLDQRDKEIKTLLGPKGTDYTEEQRLKLKNIINGIVDYSSMAQFALHQTYDTLSADQRKEFINLFSTIVRDQSLNRLDIYRADVTYNTIDVEGDSAFVSTMVQLDNVRTPVDYQMYYDSSQQQWLITDMIIDDVSTAQSYRRQFQSIIRKKGYNSLIETLRKRAGQ